MLTDNNFLYLLISWVLLFSANCKNTSNHQPEFLMHQIDAKAGFASVPVVKFQMIDALYQNRDINEFCKYQVIKSELETAMPINRLNLKTKNNNSPSIGSSSLEPINDLNKAIELYKVTNPPADLMYNIEEHYKKLMK